MSIHISHCALARFSMLPNMLREVYGIPISISLIWCSLYCKISEVFQIHRGKCSLLWAVQNFDPLSAHVLQPCFTHLMAGLGIFMIAPLNYITWLLPRNECFVAAINIQETDNLKETRTKIDNRNKEKLAPGSWWASRRVMQPAHKSLMCTPISVSLDFGARYLLCTPTHAIPNLASRWEWS